MDINTLLLSISIIDTLLLLICFSIIYVNREVITSSIKILGLFLTFSFLIQIPAIVLPYLEIHNLWLLHLYTLGEFILLSLFYYELFEEEENFKKFIKFALPLISLLVILNSIFLQPITGFNSYAKTLVQFTLIVYAVYHFYTVSTKEILVSSQLKSLHLINSAILLYYAGSLFIFMFVNFLKSDNFWIFNAFLYLGFLIVILIGIWKAVFNRENLM